MKYEKLECPMCGQEIDPLVVFPKLKFKIDTLRDGIEELKGINKSLRRDLDELKTHPVDEDLNFAKLRIKRLEAERDTIIKVVREYEEIFNRRIISHRHPEPNILSALNVKPPTDKEPYYRIDRFHGK